MKKIRKILPFIKNRAAKIGIYGAGSWGGALAVNLAQNHKVKVYSLFEQEFNNKNIKLTLDVQKLKKCDYLLLCVPTQNVREFLDVCAPHIPKKAPILICCKGVEQATLKLPSQIVQEYLPNPIAALSGPNFADEIAQLKPAATNIACADIDLGEQIIEAVSSPTLRGYYVDDVIATQVCGAIKNVIAIASGIVMGRNLGENARASLITRSLNEISLLCKAMGGNPAIINNLAGVGDLMLTCSSLKSRNTNFGYHLAKGEDSTDILKNSEVVEGYYTAKTIKQLMEKYNIEMPICMAVYNILYEAADINEQIQNLLRRPIYIS